MAGQDPGEEVLEIFPSGPRLVLLNGTNPCKSVQIPGQNVPKCSSSPAMARKKSVAVTIAHGVGIYLLTNIVHSLGTL